MLGQGFQGHRLTRPAGWLPAEKARRRPPPRWLNRASPRMERAELPVHCTRTLKMRGSRRGLGGVEASGVVAQGRPFRHNPSRRSNFR